MASRIDVCVCVCIIAVINHRTHICKVNTLPINLISGARNLLIINKKERRNNYFSPYKEYYTRQETPIPEIREEIGKKKQQQTIWFKQGTQNRLIKHNRLIEINKIIFFRYSKVNSEVSKGKYIQVVNKQEHEILFRINVFESTRSYCDSIKFI